MISILSETSVVFGVFDKDVQSITTVCVYIGVIHLPHYAARIHSDHHDLGGVCAACCYDSYPGGQPIFNTTSLAQAH